MFGNQCPRCESGVKKRFDFCPTCGTALKESREEYGMLGKEDTITEEDFMNGNIIPGMSSSMLNKMLSGAMKMLEKELSGINENKDPKSNFQLYINGKKVGSQSKVPTIRATSDQIQQLPTLSTDIISKSKDLPREEAKYKLKRLGTKIVYEIELPGIESLNNVLINKLEGSIEVRAFTKQKVYNSNIQITLPLIRHYLKNHNLILEFQGH